MDSCFVDITVEFLAVAFHSILYYTSVYPQSIFESKRKYSIVVYQSKHPEVNQYINLCLKTITECLKSGQLKRLEFTITDNKYKPVIKFVFDFDSNGIFDETADAYLIQTEQNIRAFCLQLSTINHKLDLPEDTSFTIFIHTNESTAVSMSANPDLEDFPFVEVEEKFISESDKILPLRRFSIRHYNIDTYIELK